MNEREQNPTALNFERGHAERTMSATTCSIFNQLRLEGTLCDAVIEVKGVELNAHKVILCGCSSYFGALFTRGWHNAEQRLYSIPDVSPDIMRLIIEYAYTRSVAVEAENVEALLIAADQFCIMGVVRACCDFLEGQLCLENCIGMWKFANFYNCPGVKHKAFVFILHHFEEMVRVSEEFLELSLQQMAEITEKDELNVKQEDVVFEAILHWIGHSPDERNAHIAVLLPKVRLALMNADYLMNNVMSHALVRDNTDCRPIIINAQRAMCDLHMNGAAHSDYYSPLARPRLPYAIILAIGGWSGGGPTNGIEAYDSRADHWVNMTIDEESPRAYQGAAFLNGLVYCVGGFDGVDYFNSVRKFHPVARTWQEVAPMYSPRCYVSVVVLNGCIYAMGGFDGHVRLNTAERYEPETNQWTLIARMHERRSDASATVLHGKVYICGGFTGTECLSTAECYRPETNQWTVIEPMSSMRSGVGVVAYGGQVYAVGGFDGENRLHSVEAYNPRTNAWRDVPSMHNSRSNFGIEVVDDLLFVIGGFNGFTTTSVVECYDDRASAWYNAENMGIFRSALSCCVIHGLPSMARYIAPRDTLQHPQQEEEADGGSH